MVPFGCKNWVYCITRLLQQWRNDGVAAASRDGGGGTGKGAPDSSRLLND